MGNYAKRPNGEVQERPRLGCVLLVEDHQVDVFRAIYIARVVKKSKFGIAMLLPDVELIEKLRLCSPTTGRVGDCDDA